MTEAPEEAPPNARLARFNAALENRRHHFEHAKQRAMERYGLHLTEQIHRDMMDAVESKDPSRRRFIRKASSTSNIYAIQHNGRWYCVVVKMRLGCITSFIPEDSAGIDRQRLHQILREVADERGRQADLHYYTPEVDDHHTGYELERAAAAFLLFSFHSRTASDIWPMQHHFNPSDHRRNLIRATALATAAIERIDRLALTQRQENHGPRSERPRYL